MSLDLENDFKHAPKFEKVPRAANRAPLDIVSKLSRAEEESVLWPKR
jgi:hypothetical protein